MEARPARTDQDQRVAAAYLPMTQNEHALVPGGGPVPGPVEVRGTRRELALTTRSSGLMALGSTSRKAVWVSVFFSFDGGLHRPPNAPHSSSSSFQCSSPLGRGIVSPRPHELLDLSVRPLNFAG